MNAEFSATRLSDDVLAGISGGHLRAALPVGTGKPASEGSHSGWSALLGGVGGLLGKLVKVGPDGLLPPVTKTAP